MSEPAKQKICAICGQDCSGRARKRFKDGRYACRACLEERQGKQDQPKAMSEAEMLATGIDPLMVELISDIPPIEERTCPECSQLMRHNAVLCHHCGFNKETGKSVRTRVEKVTSGGGASGKVAGGALKAGSLAVAPVFPIIGGMIGGVIGAAIWAALAFYTGFEFGILAWLIGLSVGVGAVIGARGQGNALTGLLSAVITILSITAGKFASVQMTLDKIVEGDMFTTKTVSDRKASELIAIDIVNALIEVGERVHWPESGLSVENAEWPTDYPMSVQKETFSVWAQMDRNEREELRQIVLDDFTQNISDNRAEVAEWGFLQSFHIFDILIIPLAIGTAYKIGSVSTRN